MRAWVLAVGLMAFACSDGAYEAERSRAYEWAYETCDARYPHDHVAHRKCVEREMDEWREYEEEREQAISDSWEPI